jgi:hypothetical protein
MHGLIQRRQIDAQGEAFARWQGERLRLITVAEATSGVWGGGILGMGNGDIAQQKHCHCQEQTAEELITQRYQMSINPHHRYSHRTEAGGETVDPATSTQLGSFVFSAQPADSLINTLISAPS